MNVSFLEYFGMFSKFKFQVNWFLESLDINVATLVMVMILLKGFDLSDFWSMLVNQEKRQFLYYSLLD